MLKEKHMHDFHSPPPPLLIYEVMQTFDKWHCIQYMYVCVCVCVGGGGGHREYFCTLSELETQIHHCWLTYGGLRHLEYRLPVLTNRQLRARRTLLHLKDVPLRSRIVLSLYTKSMAIVPFWFSMKHLWNAKVPFWLSNDKLCVYY